MAYISFARSADTYLANTLAKFNPSTTPQQDDDGEKGFWEEAWDFLVGSPDSADLPPVVPLPYACGGSATGIEHLDIEEVELPDADITPESVTCIPQEEIPYNGKDEDCNGVDLLDTDGDGYCKEGYEVINKELQCPLDLTYIGTDCNDEDAYTFISTQEQKTHYLTLGFYPYLSRRAETEPSSAFMFEAGLAIRQFKVVRGWDRYASLEIKDTVKDTHLGGTAGIHYRLLNHPGKYFSWGFLAGINGVVFPSVCAPSRRVASICFDFFIFHPGNYLAIYADAGPLPTCFIMPNFFNFCS